MWKRRFWNRTFTTKKNTQNQKCWNTHSDRESMTHFLFIDNNGQQHGSEKKLIIHILRKRSKAPR